MKSPKRREIISTIALAPGEGNTKGGLTRFSPPSFFLSLALFLLCPQHKSLEQASHPPQRKILSFNLKISGMPVEQTTYGKCLGLIVDCHSNW